jgi:predicted dehydrogenase
MPEAIRVGVIGTSWWLDTAHLPMLKADPRVELVAICGRDRARAQEMADKYAIAEVYADYQEMIARARLQAIVISAPDDLHYAMAMAALDAGLHVLCEKPLALNAAHARAMYEAAEARGVRHMTFFTWRWMPHYRYMVELIAQGRIGRVVDCQFSFLMRLGRAPIYQWRHDPARANGVVGDLGAHLFDLAQYLVGEITRVSAHLAAHVPRRDADGRPFRSTNDSALVLLEFANGAHGAVHASVTASVDDPFFTQDVVLYGDAGTLRASLPISSGPPQLSLAVGDGPLQPVTIPDHYMTGVDPAQPFISQFLSLFTHQPVGCRLFIDAILAGEPAVPSFYEGWQTQRVIDAALAAHERGQWVRI